MVFLPIIERELRVASRRPGTHRIRLWTTAAGVLVSALFLIFTAIFQVRSLGPTLFHTLTFYAFGMSLLAGVFLAADCISAEKRDGTLGLLFLTDLRGYDVVFGKLASVGLGALYGLVAVLPVTALPLLLGGVTGVEFWRVSLALVNTLFFALASGIFVSTCFREAFRTMSNTVGLLFIVVVGLPLVGTAMTLAGCPASWWYFTSFSPYYPFALGSATGYYTRAQHYWLSLLNSNLFAWLLLLAASWRLPRAWQDKPLRQKPVSTAAIPSRAPFFRFRPRRTKLLEQNPILWLASDARGTRLWVWLLTAMMAVLLVIYRLTGGSMLVFAAGSYGLVLFGILLKILLAFQASRFFVEARRSGALELILSTPLTSREIVEGQWLGLRRVFLWPVLIFLAAQLTVSLFTISAIPRTVTTTTYSGTNFPKNINTLNFSSNSPPGGIVTTQSLPAWTKIIQYVFIGYGIIRWPADVIAIAWMGMWFGLSAKNPSLAAGMTLLFVVIIPAAVLCIPNLAVDIVLILWARKKLQNDFRTAAMPDYRSISLTFPPMPFSPPPA